MDEEAIKRGEMKAKVNDRGWTKCPFCGTKFSINSKMAWNGEKHNYCGTRLILEWE